MRDRIRRLGRLAWRALRLEVTLYAALGRWILRRPAVPEGATPVGYAQLVAPVMGLWIFASAMEIPLLHVLVPWEGVRLALLVVSVWGLAWMLGLYAALRVYPHLVDETGLRVRYATSVDIPLRWAQVGELRPEARDLPSQIRVVQRRDSDRGLELHVAVSARTNVTALLREPTVVATPSGPVEAVSVSLWVDDPRAFVARGRAAMADATRR
jgi:hypothetical protein